MKLSKLEMPMKKKSKLDLSELMSSDKGSNDDESAPELSDDEELEGASDVDMSDSSEDPMPEAGPEKLEALSDEELLAEIKKRGLLSHLQSEPDDGSQPESM